MRRALPGALLAAAALLAGGCGTGGKAPAQADQQAGQKLFTQKCGGCHTLAAAGTGGTLGPNLDDAFSGPKAQHFKESTLENVVLDQIRQASAPMPANLVKGQEAVDVAAYVANVAGAGGPNAKPPSQLGTDGKAIFSAECSSCHTLKAAGASGTIGPNLDSLKPALAIVVKQVTNGGSVMPAFKGKLSPAQIDAVAKFVSSSAGK
ncbi:MAG TPA: c-type cytochrome [Gaiellaceae bacterium]|nr:c-type cytochrome [Gaiellaceae bacterium]